MRAMRYGVTGAGLLVSAYAPLLVVLAALRWHELGWLAWLLVAVAGLATAQLLALLVAGRRLPRRTLRSQSCKQASERNLPFLSNYLLPVLVMLFGRGPLLTWLAQLVLLGLMAVVYVVGGLFHLNPTMFLLGYRLYEVKEAGGRETFVFTRRRHLPQVGTLTCWHLAEGVEVEIGRKDG